MECSSYKRTTDFIVNHVEVYERIQEDTRLNNLYKRSLDLDFPERVIDDKPEASQEDNKFMDKVLNSLSTQDGHYVMCLPFRNDEVLLPNNRPVCLTETEKPTKKTCKE